MATGSFILSLLVLSTLSTQIILVYTALTLFDVELPLLGYLRFLDPIVEKIMNEYSFQFNVFLAAYAVFGLLLQLALVLKALVYGVGKSLQIMARLFCFGLLMGMTYLLLYYAEDIGNAYNMYTLIGSKDLWENNIDQMFN